MEESNGISTMSDKTKSKKIFDRFVFGEHEEDHSYVCATLKGNFQTFVIPDCVNASTSYHTVIGKELIRAFRKDGLLQIHIGPEIADLCADALSESKHFFAYNTLAEKTKLVNDLSYSGYIGSGDEQTNGQADGSEIFTITPDIDLDDGRVKQKWPCHGPVPWPNDRFKSVMTGYMSEIGKIGDNLLKLMALGLDVDINTFYNYTQNGWFHMRVLRFPSEDKISHQGIKRGIGAHTDYGLLVIAAQDDVGGLYIRPPITCEKRLNNWMDNNSMAGVYENDDGWIFVEPVSNTLTVFPGDMLQLLTNGYLLSTPHKVLLNPTRDRFALAYFHEPSFDAKIETLDKFRKNGIKHTIEYGTHFTNMFMVGLPERSVTRKLKENNYRTVLKNIFNE